MKKIINFISVMLLLHANISIAQNKILYIYQDADLSNYGESSYAIQQGIEVAFDEINNHIDGYNIAFKYLDHRGNVLRSKRNYQKFIADPSALAIYSGIHSPPLIKNRQFINESEALTLVPWAAGGPITRYPAQKNWIFRLSVDDTKAGNVIIDYAINKQNCRSPHLLLEESLWGASNLKNMSKALKKHAINAPKVTRFNWGIKAKEARIALNLIIDSDSDCIILVSNAIEGAVIINEMLKFSLKDHLPIISHWGISGGDFHQVVNKSKRENLNLHFIQSCFAFTNVQQNTFSKKVFARLVKHSNGDIKQPNDLKSAVGFIHAYDLTKLLIQAIRETGMTGDIVKDRNAIRLALETIHQPVQGLIKTYNKPFSVFDTQQNFDAHEALQQSDYCMGKFGANDEILISHE
jgi:branched-chain amino acid transport system substrate-binding protein